MGSRLEEIRLQLDADAKDGLDRFCEERGMMQVTVLSRLATWFVRQDEVIQASVLGHLSDESLALLARNLLAE